MKKTEDTESDMLVQLPADWLEAHELCDGDYVILTSQANKILIQTEMQFSRTQTNTKP